MPSSDSKIIIVGAGVFGLTTALWLARGGYKDITVFDRCAFDTNHYNPANGCDGASSDLNKIFRMAYGDKQEGQRHVACLGQGRQGERPSRTPAGLTPEDQLLHVCGCYFIGQGRELQGENAQSLETMAKLAPDFRKMQFVKVPDDSLIFEYWFEMAGCLKNSPEDEERLRNIDPKWVDKYYIIDRINSGNTHGFLDINAGITIADKVTLWGEIPFLTGSWTASIVPEAHRTVEATAGTVMFVDIPKYRQDLRRRFHPDNYPVWSYRAGEGDEAYSGGGYPISKEGRLKFSSRGRKTIRRSQTCMSWFVLEPLWIVSLYQHRRISTPRTKYSENPINTVPLYGLSRMKKVVSEAFPELVEFGFTNSRLCWYTDTIDEDYVVDYVPGSSKSLFICTGGCGHAFKFLPILGRHVKNQLEGVPDQFSPVWKWRVVEEGKHNNGLSEGADGPREMSRLKMANPLDFAMDNRSTSRL
ncbi:hypothetical protein ACJ41O_014471 [Fusarium nematophilum]